MVTLRRQDVASLNKKAGALRKKVVKLDKDHRRSLSDVYSIYSKIYSLRKLSSLQTTGGSVSLNQDLFKQAARNALEVARLEEKLPELQKEEKRHWESLIDTGQQLSEIGRKIEALKAGRVDQENPGS